VRIGAGMLYLLWRVLGVSWRPAQGKRGGLHQGLPSSGREHPRGEPRAWTFQSPPQRCPNSVPPPSCPHYLFDLRCLALSNPPPSSSVQSSIPGRLSYPSRSSPRLCGLCGEFLSTDYGPAPCPAPILICVTFQNRGSSCRKKPEHTQPVSVIARAPRSASSAPA